MELGRDVCSPALRVMKATNQMKQLEKEKKESLLSS
ncbi:hypothetical protein H8957_007479 [Semnopithecus entellus]